MSRYLLFFLIVFPLNAFAQDDLKVMTYNIRYANPNDGVNYWENRQNRVYKLINDQSPDIIGLQEVLYSQVQDLSKALDTYSWLGVGRDDGKIAGEFSPVFYKSDRFILQEARSIWLSDSPDEPSKGWDAALPRIASIVKLFDLSSNKTIAFVNTHFDHVGKEARKESAKLLVQQAAQLKADHIVVVGDLNFEPDTEGYASLKSLLSDSFYGKEHPFTSSGTYRGFGVSESNGKRIDYVFHNGLNVVNYVVDERNDGSNYPSDHLPVIVDFRY